MTDLIDKYVEHEVQLRAIREITGDKFLYINIKFNKLKTKLDSLIVLVISGIVIPVLLHWAKIL